LNFLIASYIKNLLSVFFYLNQHMYLSEEVLTLLQNTNAPNLKFILKLKA